MRIMMIAPLGMSLAYEAGKRKGKEILIEDLKRKVEPQTHMEKVAARLLGIRP